MSLRAVLIGALAETPVHPGTGQSGGTIDLPVAREGGTNYPFIPGSSSKGSTKQRTGGDPEFFGTPAKQGSMMFGDFRLLLLPLRSSDGAYKWATCPHLLERLRRDLDYAGYTWTVPRPDNLAEGEIFASSANQATLLLEEMAFGVKAPPDPAIPAALARLLPEAEAYQATRERVPRQLLIMSDDDFGWFARFGLPVHAHNVLDKDTKTSTNLWYEESLPADTLLYSVVAPRTAACGPNTDAAKALDKVLAKLRDDPWIQFGGNETTGHGVCRLSIVDAAA